MKEIHEIKLILKDRLQKYTNLPMNSILTADIKETISVVLKELLQEELFDFNEIKFEVTNDAPTNTTKITPKNLFTVLLLNGFFIQPNLLIGMSQYSPPYSNIIYGYDEENGPYQYFTQVRYKKYSMGELLEPRK
jgi:hypothetical protein